MAAYGTLVAWARAMGHEDAVGLLEEILEEEKAADEKLTSLAEGGINADAASQAHPESEEEEEGELVGAGAGGARGASRASSARGASRASTPKSNGRTRAVSAPRRRR